MMTAMRPSTTDMTPMVPTSRANDGSSARTSDGATSATGVGVAVDMRKSLLASDAGAHVNVFEPFAAKFDAAHRVARGEESRCGGFAEVVAGVRLQFHLGETAVGRFTRRYACDM